MRSVRTAAALVCGLLLWTSSAVAQERAPDAPAPGREHFQLKFGAGYDQGDFGTHDTKLLRAGHVSLSR